MTVANSLTQERLKELLSYDPETGVFTWLTKRGKGEAGAIAGSPHNMGYVRIGIGGKAYLAHRLAWLYVHGHMPSEIDHRNRIGTDNRISNLRPATHIQNTFNKKTGTKNTSGVQGVSWICRAKMWRVRITAQKTTIYLGYYRNIFDAACARKSAELRHFGEFAPTAS